MWHSVIFQIASGSPNYGETWPEFSPSTGKVPKTNIRYTRRWACAGCGGGRLLRREPEDRRYPEGVPASRSHAHARGGSSLEGRHPAMSDEAFILEKKAFHRTMSGEFLCHEKFLEELKYSIFCTLCQCCIVAPLLAPALFFLSKTWRNFWKNKVAEEVFVNCYNFNPKRVRHALIKKGNKYRYCSQKRYFSRFLKKLYCTEPGPEPQFILATLRSRSRKKHFRLCNTAFCICTEGFQWKYLLILLGLIASIADTLNH